MTRPDLAPQEQTHVRTALKFLRARCGGWAAVGKALAFEPRTLARVAYREKPVSARMAVRVAHLARVGVDDVLAGRFPAPNACPHCGHVGAEAAE